MTIELNASKMLGLRLLTAHGQTDVVSGCQSILLSKNGKPFGTDDFPVLCLKEGKPNGPLRFKSGASLSAKVGKPGDPAGFEQAGVLDAKVGKQDGIGL